MFTTPRSRENVFLKYVDLMNQEIESYTRDIIRADQLHKDQVHFSPEERARIELGYGTGRFILRTTAIKAIEGLKKRIGILKKMNQGESVTEEEREFLFVISQLKNTPEIFDYQCETGVPKARAC